MLSYFVCISCKQASDLFLDSELPPNPPACTPCTEQFGFSLVEKKQVSFFIAYCDGCKRTMGNFSSQDFTTYKQSPPKCLKCNTNRFIVVVNPHLYQQKPERVKKRKTPGYLEPKIREHMKLYKEGKLEKSLPLNRKRKFDELVELEDKILSTTIEFQPGDKHSLLAQSESTYQQQKKKRKLFDEKNGPLLDMKNPLKTSSHTGTLVLFSEYQDTLKHTGTIGDEEYPKLSKSAPLIVNSAKLVDRNTTWDYRELGPNSLLRRLCSLLYMIEFKGGSSTTNNPVEVQAMWANGSLFLSSNNYTFSDKLLKAMQKEGSLRDLLKRLELNQDKTPKTGDYKTTSRNFGTFHMQKMVQYRKEFVTGSYQKYFEYKWRYVFDVLKAALKFGSLKMDSLTVFNDEDGFESWTCEGPILAGMIYVVRPNNKKKEGETFKKKMVHAEELFYPILMKLKKGAKLSKVQPAFIGGVKTPCRTCAMVLETAADKLGDWLILPTDAHGHYWEASGMHVPDKTFDEDDVTMVFGSKKSIDDGSINIYNTEMPPSPKND